MVGGRVDRSIKPRSVRFDLFQFPTVILFQRWREFVPCNLPARSFFLQVYEMYVTGYQFKVLSPVFTVHWGLQTRKSRPAWRERQNSANRKQFETFKKEVFARYMRDPLKMMKNTNWRKARRGSRWFESPSFSFTFVRLDSTSRNPE